MQGTIAVLVALSGLGCHHKSCDTYCPPACYSSHYDGCYASACYSYAMPTSQWMGCYSGCYSLTQAAYWDSCYGSACYGSCYGSACYASACYGGCYGSCYGGCYGGHRRMRHHHGLFGCKRNSCEVCCASGQMMPYGGGGWPMGMPVFGTYTPTYYDMGTPQGVMSSQWGGTQYMNDTTTTEPANPPPVAPETPEGPVEDTTVPDVDTTSPPINDTLPTEPGGVEGTIPGAPVETPVNPQGF